MNVLTVYAHPNPLSFNHAVLESFTKGLADGGHACEVIDLYAIDFDPVFRMDDYSQFFREDVPLDVIERMRPRELILSLAEGPVRTFLAKWWLKSKTTPDLVKTIGDSPPDDVAEHQEKVAWADALAFICPVWWMGVPAMLKGWMERVLAYGVAYRLTEDGWMGDVSGREPLLKHEKALIINTTFFREPDYRELGMHDAMDKLLVQWGLKFPGIPNVEHVFLYNVMMVDDETRQGYLDRAYQLGREFQPHGKDEQ